VLAYQTKTEEILQRFFGRRLDRSQCRDELFFAFTAVLPNLTADNIGLVQTLAHANEASIWWETARRDGCSYSVKE
jgi:hypothetical protein